MSITTKLCNKCKEEKQLEDFYKTHNGFGLKSICKKCEKDRVSKWGKNNRDKVKISNKKWQDKNPDFRKIWKEKNLEKHKASQKKYRNNNEKYKEKQKKLNEERHMNTRNYIVNYKESIGCLNPNCYWKGDSIACTLDFHHLDPNTKELTLSKSGLHSKDTIIKEIKKCTILCANCHRLVSKKILDDSNFPLCKIDETIDYSKADNLKIDIDLYRSIFEQTAFNHFFEEKVAELHRLGKIKIPTYLSLGTEHIASTLVKTGNWTIFPQHRCHSYYLSFNGNPLKLLKELMGSNEGCNNGMGGSASISLKNQIFAHDGLLGSNYPLAAGFCNSTNKQTVAIIGDGAAEEDGVLSTFGYVVTKKLPLLTIVEDNGLSILTKTSIRRSWDVVNVARGFGMEATNIDNDDPGIIYNTIQKYKNKLPALLNIKVCRQCWHCGGEIDNKSEWNRYELMKTHLSNNNIDPLEIEQEAKSKVEEIVIKL